MRVTRRCSMLSILMMGCLSGTDTASHAADRTNPWKLIYANIEPDRLKPPSDGKLVPLQNGPGAYLRIVVANRGPDADRITDVSLNGVSLRQALQGRSHPRVQQYPFYKQHSIEFMEGGAPKVLLDAGRPLWYRILPSNPDTGIGWTEIIVRLRHWHRVKIQVQLKTAAGRRMTIPVQTAPGVQSTTLMQNVHIGLATLHSARDRLYVYMLVPRAS